MLNVTLTFRNDTIKHMNLLIKKQRMLFCLSLPICLQNSTNVTIWEHTLNAQLPCNIRNSDSLNQPDCYTAFNLLLPFHNLVFYILHFYATKYATANSFKRCLILKYFFSKVREWWMRQWENLPFAAGACTAKIRPSQSLGVSPRPPMWGAEARTLDHLRCFPRPLTGS